MKFPRTSIAVSSAAPAISTFAATLIEAHTLSLFLECDRPAHPYSPMYHMTIFYHIGLLQGIQGKKAGLSVSAVLLPCVQKPVKAGLKDFVIDNAHINKKPADRRPLR
jgi:hypothetical protein